MPERLLAGTALLVLAAIGITTAMDAMGLSNFSALPLLPLAAIGWWLEKHSKRAMGIAWGQARGYALAAVYPLLVLGTLAAIAIAAGAADPNAPDWSKASRDFALMAGATIPVALLTEEGFFRGWLPASLDRAGLGARAILISSSIVFALWHVSAVTLDTGFDLPVGRIPVFLANAAVLGAIWGTLRLDSGSIVVASLSHGLWNGGAYVLFGYGAKAGTLGIADGTWFNPESGWAGLLLNLVFLGALRFSRR